MIFYKSSFFLTPKRLCHFFCIYISADWIKWVVVKLCFYKDGFINSKLHERKLVKDIDI